MVVLDISKILHEDEHLMARHSSKQNWPFHSRQKSSGQRGTILIAFLMSVLAVFEPTPDVLTN